MNYLTVADYFVDSGTVHETGSGKVKLARPVAQVLAAYLHAIASEWDSLAYSLERLGDKISPRDFAQKKYAEHASAALRQAATRVTQSIHRNSLTVGFSSACDQMDNTDLSVLAKSPVVIRGKRCQS